MVPDKPNNTKQGGNRKITDAIHEQILTLITADKTITVKKIHEDLLGLGFEISYSGLTKHMRNHITTHYRNNGKWKKRSKPKAQPRPKIPPTFDIDADADDDDEWDDPEISQMMIDNWEEGNWGPHDQADE